MNISETEKSRVSRIILSIENRSWDLFKSLSDVGFPHEENMRHQFDITAKIVCDMNSQWNLEVNLIHDPSNVRMIHVKFVPINNKNEPIILLLQSTNAGENSTISIISFYEHYKFS